MLKDVWGSDFDYDTFFGNCPQDEREDWCDEHKQKQSSCAKCVESGAINEDGELVRAVKAALRGEKGAA